MLHLLFTKELLLVSSSSIAFFLYTFYFLNHEGTIISPWMMRVISSKIWTALALTPLFIPLKRPLAQLACSNNEDVRYPPLSSFVRGSLLQLLVSAQMKQKIV